MRVGIVTVRQPNGDVGGAERFFDALTSSFQQNGHDAVEVPVFADESTFDQIKHNYVACYDLDLRGFDMVVSTKAPTWLVRHPRHVCYLVHTIRVFYDMFEETFPWRSEELLAQRDLVHKLDTAALQEPRCRAVFTIGEEVSRRLRDYNAIESVVLHPPLWSGGFHFGRQGNYFLLPGRLHPWKRVDLVIKAMEFVRRDVKLKVVGTGEGEAELRQLAQDDDRIEFLGRVDDASLRELYAGALAVPFTPNREDYGYVTLEAFASSKPVITCRDSGEACSLVQLAGGGVVTDPDPRAIGKALSLMASNRQEADAMGRSGKRWVEAMSWTNIVNRLIESAFRD